MENILTTLHRTAVRGIIQRGRDLLMVHSTKVGDYKPKQLGKLMGDPDPEKYKRVTEAMLKKQNIFIADLQKACGG
jgi:hypothetical protein